MFWMKSSLAVPSRFIMKTAKLLKEISEKGKTYLWGSLMHELAILTKMLAYSWKSTINFYVSCMCLKESSVTVWV